MLAGGNDSKSYQMHQAFQNDKAYSTRMIHVQSNICFGKMQEDKKVNS